MIIENVNEEMLEKLWKKEGLRGIDDYQKQLENLYDFTKARHERELSTLKENIQTVINFRLEKFEEG